MQYFLIIFRDLTFAGMWMDWTNSKHMGLQFMVVLMGKEFNTDTLFVRYYAIYFYPDSQERFSG